MADNIFEGKTWRYGDNIDTDVIIPARYLNSFDPKDLAAHCMEDSDEHTEAPFAANVVEGDIMVGGKNFGYGINMGRPLVEIGTDVEKIHHGDKLKVDVATGTIENLTTGDTFHAQPLPGFVQEIAKAGGLINYIKEKK